MCRIVALLMFAACATFAAGAAYDVMRVNSDTEDGVYTRLLHRRDRRSVTKTASVGGSEILECDIKYPNDEFVEHIIQWRKQGIEVPIFIQFNGYPPHVDAGYQGRLTLVEQASVKVSEIKADDQGWFECSIVFLDGNDESTNGTWIYLKVHAPPVLGQVSPSFLIQKKGDTVEMYCEASANPDPTLLWYKDGKRLQASKRVSIGKSKITVHQVRHEDGGVYTCTFRNNVGQVSHVIKMVVEGEGWISSGRAYIMGPPKNTTAEEGAKVKLECQAEASPSNITYRWFKDGEDVQHVEGLMSRAGIYTDGSFVIKEVRKDDNGWYKCRPSNGLGVPPEAKAYLNVTYLPRVLNMPVSLLLPKGMQGRIHCPVEANPPVTMIIWTKNERTIDPSLNNNMQVERGGTLVITSVSSSDEGRYTCTPYSPLGVGRRSKVVQVVVKDPPHFTARPAPYYQKQPGKQVTLPCQANGDPKPSISWRKADGKFPSNQRTLQDAGNLTIMNLLKEDHGVYECVASNVVTTIITTTLLVIEMTTPHAPYNVTVDASQFSARISWLPAYDGGFPQHYVLWYKMHEGVSDEWKTLRVIPDSATSATLYKLYPDTVYQFMVKSWNRMGEGMFSKVVTAKTRGYVPGLGTVLPTDASGSTYIPTVVKPVGPRPNPPRNVTVRQQADGLLIAWLPPKEQDEVPPPVYYVIKYRTVGQWVPLNGAKIRGQTTYLWTTSSRGATYHFQVYSHTLTAHSLPSEKVSLSTGDPLTQGWKITDNLIGGIVGGLVFLLCSIILATIAVKICNHRKRRERAMRYGNVKYFGPKQIEANQKYLPKMRIHMYAPASCQSGRAPQHSVLPPVAPPSTSLCLRCVTQQGSYSAGDDASSDVTPTNAVAQDDVTLILQHNYSNKSRAQRVTSGLLDVRESTLTRKQRLRSQQALDLAHPVGKPVVLISRSADGRFVVNQPAAIPANSRNRDQLTTPRELPPYRPAPPPYWEHQRHLRQHHPPRCDVKEVLVEQQPPRPLSAPPLSSSEASLDGDGECYYGANHHDNLAHQLSPPFAGKTVYAQQVISALQQRLPQYNSERTPVRDVRLHPPLTPLTRHSTMKQTSEFYPPVGEIALHDPSGQVSVRTPRIAARTPRRPAKGTPYSGSKSAGTTPGSQYCTYLTSSPELDDPTPRPSLLGGWEISSVTQVTDSRHRSTITSDVTPLRLTDVQMDEHDTVVAADGTLQYSAPPDPVLEKMRHHLPYDATHYTRDDLDVTIQRLRETTPILRELREVHDRSPLLAHSPNAPNRRSAPDLTLSIFEGHNGANNIHAFHSQPNLSGSHQEIMVKGNNLMSNDLVDNDLKNGDDKPLPPPLPPRQKRLESSSRRSRAQSLPRAPSPPPAPVARRALSAPAYYRTRVNSDYTAQNPCTYAREREVLPDLDDICRTSRAHRSQTSTLQIRSTHRHSAPAASAPKRKLHNAESNIYGPHSAAAHDPSLMQANQSSGQFYNWPGHRSKYTIYPGISRGFPDEQHPPRPQQRKFAAYQTSPSSQSRSSSGFTSQNTSNSARNADTGNTFQRTDNQPHRRGVDLGSGGVHAREASADENYEFDHIQSLENELLDVLRLYRQHPQANRGWLGAFDRAHADHVTDSATATAEHGSREPTFHRDSVSHSEKLRHQYLGPGVAYFESEVL